MASNTAAAARVQNIIDKLTESAPNKDNDAKDTGAAEVAQSNMGVDTKDNEAENARSKARKRTRADHESDKQGLCKSCRASANEVLVRLYRECYQWSRPFVQIACSVGENWTVGEVLKHLTKHEGENLGLKRVETFGRVWNNGTVLSKQYVLSTDTLTIMGNEFSVQVEDSNEYYLFTPTIMSLLSAMMRQQHMEDANKPKEDEKKSNNVTSNSSTTSGSTLSTTTSEGPKSTGTATATAALPVPPSGAAIL